MRIPLNRFSLEALLAWGLGSLIVGGIIGAILAFSVWRVADTAFDEYEKQDAPLALNASKGVDAWRKARDYEEAMLTSYGGSLDPAEARQRYFPLWKSSLDQVRGYLTGVRTLGGENDHRALALLPDTEKALARYADNLTQVVDGMSRIGRADTGLEGQIRAKTREIEAVLAKHRSPALHESLGHLQRIRMDYALTGRDRYIEEFDVEAKHFQRLAAGAPALVALGRDFTGLFGQYVRISEGMGPQKQAVLEAAKQLDPGLELLETESLGNAHDALLVFERRITGIAAASAAVAVVAVLLGLAIAVLIGGRIRLATQRIIGFATHVAAGRLGARLDELDTGEFGALESALNTMADRLQQSDEIMNRQARLLEASNRRIGLLSELTSLLQTAQDMEEAVRISGRHLNEMHLASLGALYLYQEAGDRLEAFAHWGEGHSVPDFAPADCWALRRGQPYGTSEGMTALPCAHSTHPQHEGEQVSYLCLPMLAQSAMIGLLYVVFDMSEGSDPQQREEDTRFARRLSEQLSLALANLKLRQSLREQSLSDALTQLPNRRCLEELLPRELARARRDKGRLALLMVDADHFKRFNDEHGHDAGDTALRQLGRVLKQNCRASDLACRYGGEEFTVILPDTTAEGAQEWARRLLEAVRSIQIRARDAALAPLTVSIGAAVFPEHGEEVEALMQAADAALYEAKHAGRDQLKLAKNRLRAV